MNLRISYRGELATRMERKLKKRLRPGMDDGSFFIDLPFIEGNSSSNFIINDIRGLLPTQGDDSEECHVSLETEVADPDCWPDRGRHEFEGREGDIYAMVVVQKPGIARVTVWIDEEVVGDDQWACAVEELYLTMLKILSHNRKPTEPHIRKELRQKTEPAT